MESDYDMDVALSVVSTLQGMKIKEFVVENDLDKKHTLEKEIAMMRFEYNALYQDGALQQSILDKVFKLYAPILGAHYAET
jgi:hypothetical protein